MRVLAVALIALTVCCGVAAAQDRPAPRIIGGNVADPADWGFAAALETDFGQQFCGGSLIAPDWVLTAGHCRIYAPGSVRVVTGAADLRSPGAQISRVAQFVRHPRWRMKVEGAPRDDLMLVRLETASSAPVAALATEATPPAAGTYLRVAGWGSTSYNRVNDTFGPGAATLRSVRVRVRSSADCVNAYGSGVFVPTEMLCASLPGQDACAGDSGGPLMRGQGAAARLVGVVSWGTGCALPRYPGVYSTIAANRCWIASSIAPPAAPSATAIAQEAGALTLEWAWGKPCPEAPDVTAFVVRVAETGQVFEVPGADRRTTITGLTDGVPLTLSVAAVNRNGEGAPAQAVAAPTPAQAVIERAAWSGYRTADVAFSIPPHAAPLAWRVEYGSGLRFTAGAWSEASPSDAPVRVRTSISQLPVGVAPDVRIVVENGTTSRSIELAQPIEPQPIRTPVVRGVPRVGATLACDLGRWTGTRPFTIVRSWLRDGVTIAGATARTRRLRAVDAGSRVACRIRVTAPGGITAVRTPPVQVLE